MNKEDILKELIEIIEIANNTDYMWYYDDNGVYERLLELIKELEQ